MYLPHARNRYSIGPRISILLFFLSMSDFLKFDKIYKKVATYISLNCYITMLYFKIDIVILIWCYKCCYFYLTMHYVHVVREKRLNRWNKCLKVYWLHGVHCWLSLHVTCQNRNLILIEKSNLNRTKTLIRSSMLKLWIDSLLYIVLNRFIELFESLFHHMVAGLISWSNFSKDST
jgi:hypothetical protein